MIEQMKKIGVSSLLGARPTSGPEGERFSPWEIRFKLSPIPDALWREMFNDAAHRSFQAKKDSEDGIEVWEDRETPPSISDQDPDVVALNGSPNGIPDALREIKTLVKTVNGAYTKRLEEKRTADIEKNSILKQVEEWKTTLEFDK
jgi:hypothetical protein